MLTSSMLAGLLCCFLTSNNYAQYVNPLNNYYEKKLQKKKTKTHDLILEFSEQCSIQQLIHINIALENPNTNRYF